MLCVLASGSFPSVVTKVVKGECRSVDACQDQFDLEEKAVEGWLFGDSTRAVLLTLDWIEVRLRIILRDLCL